MGKSQCFLGGRNITLCLVSSIKMATKTLKRIRRISSDSSDDDMEPMTKLMDEDLHGNGTENKDPNQQSERVKSSTSSNIERAAKTRRNIVFPKDSSDSSDENEANLSYKNKNKKKLEKLQKRKQQKSNARFQQDHGSDDEVEDQSDEDIDDFILEDDLPMFQHEEVPPDSDEVDEDVGVRDAKL